jgi:rubrerythrin
MARHPAKWKPDMGEERLWICPHCDAELDADCVGDTCPVCRANLGDETDGDANAV